MKLTDSGFPDDSLPISGFAALHFDRVPLGLPVNEYRMSSALVEPRCNTQRDPHTHSLLQVLACAGRRRGRPRPQARQVPRFPSSPLDDSGNFCNRPGTPDPRKSANFQTFCTTTSCPAAGKAICWIPDFIRSPRT